MGLESRSRQDMKGRKWMLNEQGTKSGIGIEGASLEVLLLCTGPYVSADVTNPFLPGGSCAVLGGRYWQSVFMDDRVIGGLTANSLAGIAPMQWNA